MKNGKRTKIVLIALCMLISMASCDTIDKMIENTKDIFENGGIVSDYDKGIKNILSADSTALSLYTYIPTENLSTYADTESAEAKVLEKKDSFENDIAIYEFPALDNSEDNIIYMQILLDEISYKDRLNVILTDTAEVMKEYKNNSSRLMVVAYDSNNGLMEWYANIDVDSKSNDRTIMAVGDYISYINAVTSDFSVENQNYFYDCTITKDIYDIDIFDELDGANEYTSADLQRQTKSKIDRETLNAIEYHSYNYNLDYKVYLDNKDTLLTVHLYPLEGELDKNNVDAWSVSEVVNDINKSAATKYKDVEIYIFKSNGGKSIFAMENGEITYNDLA